MLFKILLVFLSFNLIKSYQKTSNGSFLKKYKVYSEIDKLFKKEINNPLILNGEKSKLKCDFCKYMCDLNNYRFKEYNFDNFILSSPYLSFEKTLLYVNDFMVGNGRIFNNYEEEKILHLPETNNIIILQSDNIENIPFKDNNIVKRYSMVNFPKITKKDIINIYDYDTNMYILNWNEYNLDNIELEYLNMLLFEVNSMFNNSIKFNVIHNNMNFLIEEFKIENHFKY